MGQRFKSYNGGAAIPLREVDLVIAGGTPVTYGLSGTCHHRARIERSGYVERAEYIYGKTDATFRHVDGVIGTESLRLLDSALKLLGEEFARRRVEIDANDLVLSLRIWFSGKPLEVIVPAEPNRSGSLNDDSVFFQVWNTVRNLLPRFPDSV